MIFKILFAFRFFLWYFFSFLGGSHFQLFLFSTSFSFYLLLNNFFWFCLFDQKIVWFCLCYVIYLFIINFYVWFVPKHHLEILFQNCAYFEIWWRKKGEMGGKFYLYKSLVNFCQYLKNWENFKFVTFNFIFFLV
jgi:hypothetical protein